VPQNYKGDDNLTETEKNNIYKLIEVLNTAKILFRLDSDAPKIDNTYFITESAKILKQEPSLHLIIEGYTCDLGSDEYNRDLAMRRAEAIRDLFIRQGTNASQLETAAYITKDPASQLNIQDPNREEHRAVMFRIYKKR
jgi:outer membrane protein OmpA-like peptidoglycan-associated protein